MKVIGSFLVLFGLFLIPTQATECVVHDDCECLYEDGSGYNLKPLVAGDDFLQSVSSDNCSFFYHPCGDTKHTPQFPQNVTNECEKSGYMLCMYNATENVAKVLGHKANMEFKMDGNQMQIIFTNVEQVKKHSVLLECAPQSKTSVLWSPLTTSSDQINLSVYSKFACLNQVEIEHRGFFYTFFIILLTLLFVYLFLGMLVNYFFIGARGYELIPNYDFWCKFWKSLKLGFIYVKNGCRVIPADDSYDAI